MPSRARAWIGVALAVGAIAAFWPVLEQPFLGYDDDVYVVDNPDVNRGLGLAGARAALLGFRAANWHPVTWLSHQLDVTLFGLDPAGHHATSLLLHALNSVLLFLWLVRAAGEGALRRCAFVAAVFAVHPLAVDSVAWIAERKNLLATGFGFAAIYVWIGWVRDARAARYLAVVLLFALGLMAKPILVVLPLLLLTLDVWPLARVPRVQSSRLVIEKLPLLALSAGAAGLTLLAQSGGGAVEGLDPFPLGVRLANAIVALPTYLSLVVWPAWPNGMAILHPHPGAALPAWKWLGALACVAALAAVVARVGRRRPYLWMGALWSGIGLLPVIGLVQVGAQSHAERYAYLPMIGVTVAATWWVADLARERRASRRRVGLLATGVLLLLASSTRSELRHWRDEIALFRRAIEVHERGGSETRHAMILYYQLGTALQREGRLDEAVAAYRRAIEANPDDPRPHNNLGTSLTALGRDAEAARHFEDALEVEPRHPAALYNLAIHEAGRGDGERARALFVRFLETAPASSDARSDAIRALIDLGAPETAVRAALRSVPPDVGGLTLGAESLRRAGRDAHARAVLEQALRIAPGHRVVRNNLAWLLATSERPEVRDPGRAVELMQQLEAEAPLDAAERDTLERSLDALGMSP